MQITAGVPKGSVLGHLLFIIFRHDISQDRLISVLFADAAVFYAQFDNSDSDVALIESFLLKRSTCLASDRLIAHVSKTKLMLVTPPHHPQHPNVLFNGMYYDVCLVDACYPSTSSPTAKGSVQRDVL